jgi:tetratricopeptide (TPR) repeat protein
VSRYFFTRYLASGSVDLLRETFASMEPTDGELFSLLLEDPLLGHGEFREAVVAGNLDDHEVVSVLERADRWTWALRAARRVDEAAGGRAREGLTRIRRAAYLLGLGARSAALEEAELALQLRGGEFEEWLVLGEARLAAGKVDEAIDALVRAARAGTAPREIRRALHSAEVTPDRKLELWRLCAEAGDGFDLEVARAYLELERPAEAQEVLRPHLGSGGSVAEASYLMARSFEISGSRSMALKYAREAARAEPRNVRYEKLVRALESEDR